MIETWHTPLTWGHNHGQIILELRVLLFTPSTQIRVSRDEYRFLNSPELQDRGVPMFQGHFMMKNKLHGRRLTCPSEVDSSCGVMTSAHRR